MPAPPAKTEISDTYPNPSNATARTGFGKLWDTLFAAVGGLLGTTGNAIDAREALGVGAISGRNRVINGNFQINQRGVSGTVVLSAGQYGHDRWKAGASGCTYTFSTSGLDTTITISAGSLQQVVEANNVEGGSYVMSWTGTAQGKIGAGSYSASGVTATGVTANANLTIEFNTGTLTRVQLEMGSKPSIYERLVWGQQLVLCQRYYETGTARLGAYAGAGGMGCYYHVRFAVSKRAAPTLGYASTSNSNVSTFDARDATTDGLRWYSVSTAAGAIVWDGTWNASAEL